MNKASLAVLSNMTAPSTREEWAAIKEDYDKIQGEYDAKFKELLGNTDFEKYQAYEDRKMSRYYVGLFSSTLSDPADQLTEAQKKDLVEIFYNLQEKAHNERDYQSLSGSAISATEELKILETSHQRITDAAKDTLSSSQLEIFKSFLKKQREEKEAISSQSDSTN
jgi:hypothetical protein